jgi:starch synthase
MKRPTKPPAGGRRSGALAGSDKRQGPDRAASVAPPATRAPRITSAAGSITTGGAPRLDIWMVASEGVPYAKTGGLADVVGALPAALGRLGHQVTTVLPRYRGVATGRASGTLVVRLGPRLFDVQLSEHHPSPGVRVLLADCPELYDRDGIYGSGGADHADNPARYGVLARVALQASLAGRPPSVFHGHDWQAGLLPVFQRQDFQSSPIAGVPTIFSIHNISYQGLFPAAWMPALGLGWDFYTVNGLEYWDRGSFLKAGIVFSSVITTVSAKYAREIQTPEFGFGFEGIVAGRASDLVGITNGIDTREWDPETDPHLPQPFSAESLGGKAAAKARVLERFGLSRGEGARGRPLVGLISRLIDQKGFDLLAALGEGLASIPASFVVLGSGARWYEDFWREMARRHPSRIAAHIGFDESLAHLIEGGADIFLMPSRFEPCGLNQMYSLRYGTVPVVRAVGGLDDTVDDYTGPPSHGTGFKFSDYSPGAVLGALYRALDVYQREDEWKALQIRGMARDHSWDAAARQYVQVYERARAAVSRAPSA